MKGRGLRHRSSAGQAWAAAGARPGPYRRVHASWRPASDDAPIVAALRPSRPLLAARSQRLQRSLASRQRGHSQAARATRGLRGGCAASAGLVGCALSSERRRRRHCRRARILRKSSSATPQALQFPCESQRHRPSRPSHRPSSDSKEASLQYKEGPSLPILRCCAPSTPRSCEGGGSRPRPHLVKRRPSAKLTQ